MAIKLQSVRSYVASPKKRRPGVNSKKRTSKNKSSKYYVKAYRGQGR